MRDHLVPPRFPRQVILLLIVVAVLTVLSLISNLLWLQGSSLAKGLRLLLSVDQEMSLPTWWSSATLAGLGVLTWFVGQGRESESRIERLAWAMLAFGFVFLSIDEFCMLHERIGGLVPVDGLFKHARWIILWLPLGGMVGSFVLWKLWRTSKQTVIGLILGAAVFLSGAVGVELLNTVMRRQAEYQADAQALDATQTAKSQDKTGKRNLPYVAGTAVEELLEMLGVVIWFGVMIRARDEVEQAKSGGESHDAQRR